MKFTKGELNRVRERLWAFAEESTMRKIFGYCRVSTSDQNNNLQKDSLLSAGVTDLFEETASGAQRDRKELKKILELAREGDKLVVWRLDRLARSLKQLVEIIEDLGERGIQFQSLQESIDTSTSGGKLVFGIFASLAEFERNLIRERTNAGLAAARARGRIGGRPRALNNNQIADAHLMRDNGRSLKEIAEHFGISIGTVHNTLTRQEPAVES